MPQQIKLFTQDSEHPTVESVEAAANAWLAAHDKKISLICIGQEAAYRQDGTIGIAILIAYYTEKPLPPVPPKLS